MKTTRYRLTRSNKYEQNHKWTTKRSMYVYIYNGDDLIICHKWSDSIYGNQREAWGVIEGICDEEFEGASDPYGLVNQLFRNDEFRMEVLDRLYKSQVGEIEVECTFKIK